MILPYFILLIVLNAISDGLKNKPLKHLFAALHILGWLMFPEYLYKTLDWHWALYPDFFEMIGIYALLRYFLFDGVWNIVRGKKIDYIGSTSLYDKLLSKIHPGFILYTKLLAAMVAIALVFT